MSAREFHYTQKVMFKHCDPAGIVFYPRYFEMMNDVVECFFAECLERPFERLLITAGVPTVQTEAEFHAPSRHGDLLDITLAVARLGRTSVSFDLVARAGDEARFTARSTLVHVDGDGRPTPWDAAIRDRFLPYIGEQDDP
ncbi:acyl-CoA thioesterase [Roseovarius sp. C7]|uniref:acyl-CoA thioesterase n=1 Tax=Roseovarius sp. C7 TaxID=3398643 RepID=UPI0039F6CB8E